MLTAKHIIQNAGFKYLITIQAVHLLTSTVFNCILLQQFM
ncbi:hypothetical protein PMAG_a0881 [Pseudoalteromonas mariniglutinosa NCIMB 1770]|nr:hypothetical protein [Pseudoalteromonas mariniglutinosa NCIMB 1770]